MNRREIMGAIGLSALSAALPFQAFSQESKMIVPPKAKKIPTEIKQLGRVRFDDYAWMRDPKWQDVVNNPQALDKEIRSHLELENAYTKSVLITPTEKLREELFQEMKGRIKEDDSTSPLPDGEYAYFQKFRTGGQYPIIARFPIDKSKIKSGDEQILIDGDIEAKGKKFWKLSNWAQSNDHSIFAYAIDFEGARNCDIRFRKTADNSEFEETLRDTTGEIIFAKDNKSIFYVQNDESLFAYKVMHHVLGTDPKTDALIYEEKDHTYYLGISESSSGEYMIIVCSASDNSECRFVPLSQPQKPAVLFAKRKKDHDYFVDHHSDYFYIKTNKDGAKDYKIMRTKISNPSVKNWVDFIGYKPGVLIENFALYKNYLVRQEVYDALPRIVIFDFDKQKESAIDFKEEAYDLDFIPGFEFDTDTMRFGYSSPTSPYETYDYNMRTKDRVLVKIQEIPSGHNKDDYVVKRINAPSEGGAKVPVTILYKKGTKIDGSAPCYLYAYGSYGISMPDGFNRNILNLVNRGWVYALAHIRGGMERGYQWYLDGKMRNKQNTFSDFINSAKALIAKKYASKGNIVAEGRSAGGLLMGVVANQAPELFKGIVAGVAFVDVMNTISDASLPLTPPEWTEWGNPLKSVKDYDTMAAYSPYDNVKTRDYPPIFAQTALSDSQVTYWEPSKWIAKLRDTSPNAGPFLLNVNMDAGHGGASGRFDRLKEIADAQAFAIWCQKR